VCGYCVFVSPFCFTSFLYVCGVCVCSERTYMYYIRSEGNRDAASLIRGLLEPNPATRLGNGAKGWSAITWHPFFTHPQPLGGGGGGHGVGEGKEDAGSKEGDRVDWVDPIDWDRLVTRQVAAPFKPEVGWLNTNMTALATPGSVIPRHSVVFLVCFRCF